MARTARIKQESECVANYHLMSRTNNKVFLFADPRMRDRLAAALQRAAAFSGVYPRCFRRLRSCGGVPEYRVLAERGRPL